MRLVLLIAIFLALTGCGVLKAKQEGDHSDLQAARAVAANPIPPEKAQELLENTGDNYIYGNGIGETAVTIGAVMIFPPYGIYVLGNTLLDLAGYEQLRMTDMLPPEDKKEWESVYDDITSGPGRIAAASAGEEFRTRDRVKTDTKNFIKSLETEQSTNEDGNYDKADRISSKD